MQLVVRWEVSVNEVQEKFAYFCCNIFTEWGLNQMICLLRCYELSFFLSCFWYVNVRL